MIGIITGIAFVVIGLFNWTGGTPWRDGLAWTTGLSAIVFALMCFIILVCIGDPTDGNFPVTRALAPVSSNHGDTYLGLSTDGDHPIYMYSAHTKGGYELKNHQVKYSTVVQTTGPAKVVQKCGRKHVSALVNWPFPASTRTHCDDKWDDMVFYVPKGTISSVIN